MTAPHHVIHIILFFTFFFFFAKDNPPLTKSDNTISGHFSFLLCHGLSPSAEPGTTQRRGGKVYYSSKKRKKLCPLFLPGSSVHPPASLTPGPPCARSSRSPGAPSESSPAGPLPPPPLPISKLTQSSGGEDGGKGRWENGGGVWRASFNKWRK